MIVAPTLFNKPFYPYGLPLKPEQIIIHDKTIEEIYIDGIDISTGKTQWSNENEETLKSFVVYFLFAPIWNFGQMKLPSRELLMTLTLDQLITKCLKYGLDPF